MLHLKVWATSCIKIRRVTIKLYTTQALLSASPASAWSSDALTQSSFLRLNPCVHALPPRRRWRLLEAVISHSPAPASEEYLKNAAGAGSVSTSECEADVKHVPGQRGRPNLRGMLLDEAAQLRHS